LRGKTDAAPPPDHYSERSTLAEIEASGGTALGIEVDGHLERRLCAALPPFGCPLVNRSDRPFSIAQLRTWNGSSCPRPWENVLCDESDAACFPAVTVETPV
jgi:hypothetical protein